MRCISIFVAIVALAASAQAKPLALPQDGLETWVPDAWTVGSDNGITAVVSPSQEASAFFVSKPVRDLDVAYKKLPSVINPIVPGLHLGKPVRKTISGLSAIAVTGVAELAGESGETVHLEATIVVVATPNQRALYAGTIVHAERAAAYDATLDKILGSLARAQSTAGASKPGTNMCWEFKGHPNGWRSQTWNGVKFVLPPEWKRSVAKDPDTGIEVLQLSDDEGSIIVFAQPSNSATETWTVVEQAADYGLGRPSHGTVLGQHALCARGSGGGTTDAVVMHKGSSALVMLSRGAGDASANRAVLGSMRWGK